MAHCTAHAYHASHDEQSRCDRLYAHLHNLLEGEFQPEGKHHEDDSYLAPVLQAAQVGYRWGIRHVWSGQEAGHYVAQHQRLVQPLEDDCDSTRNYQYVGEIAYQSG